MLKTSSYWRLRTKLEFVGILRSLIDYEGTGRINPSSNEENKIWVKIIKDCNDITNHFKFMFPEMYNSIKVHDFNIDSMVSRTHAMIYFLSVETLWIQKPPLSNVELRQMLSLISQAIIFNSNLKLSTKNGEKDKAVVRVKYAAITVLRMADKKDFIKNIFPKTLMLSRNLLLYSPLHLSHSFVYVFAHIRVEGSSLFLF